MVADPAPAGSSPVLGQLMFALEALAPMGIPGSHNLPDHRKQITDLSAMKKLRGEEEKCYSYFFLPQYLQEHYQGYQELCLCPGAHVLSARGEAVDKEGVWDLGTNWCLSSWQCPRDQTCSLHNSTKPAHRGQGGAGLHQGTTVLSDFGVPLCLTALCTYKGWRDGT